MPSKQPLLNVENLEQHFPIKGGFLGRTVNHVKAVDGITFSIDKGETIAAVGESGCGKSTTGRASLLLDEPTGGKVEFEGQDVLAMSNDVIRKIRKTI